MATTNDQIKKALRGPTPKDRIKWRTGFKNVEKGFALMLAYIDARYVQDRLDDIVGTENWSVTYNKIDNSLFCSISVTFPNGEMVTKSDCGTETDVEAEKGQASDAFKRAGVMFGIGRDLYDLGDFYADLNSNGYVEKNWKPKGWGETPKRHGQTDEDSAVPATTPQPPVPEPEPPLFDEPVVEDEKKSQTQEKVDEITERLAKSAPDDKPLKEGTPPENEWVLVKNLTEQTQSDKAVLLLDDNFKGNKAEFSETKPYWVAKQFVKDRTDLMNGKCNVIMARWMAVEKGFAFEEVIQAPANPIKDDDLPF